MSWFLPQQRGKAGQGPRPKEKQQDYEHLLAHPGKSRGRDGRTMKDLMCAVPQLFNYFIFLHTQKTWMGVEGGWGNQALSL